jgi:phage-related minor tail protein
MSTFSLNGRIGLNVSDLVSNADKARKSVSRVGEELDDVDGKLVTVDVDVEIDKAQQHILDLHNSLRGLDEDAKFEVRAEIEQAKRRLEELQDEASALAFPPRQVEVDTSEATASIRKLDGETANPTVSVDDKATSEISRVDKNVAGLDGETANPTVKLDDKASGELDDVEKQLRKDIPDAASAGGKQASGNLSDSFADLKGAGGALLGGAVAGAILGGLNVGMDRIAIRSRITQQFGLIEEDAQRFGVSAAGIYADGWGEAESDILTSLARVNQRLVQTGAIGAEETERIAKSATVLSQVFGVDVNEVIEATSKLMLNGLAPDADTALDLVATAMQGGGNAAGDLFESIDEYSVHFAAFGLGAEDMMALFMDGMNNGMRDTDKLGDAIKEMRIRTVDDTDAISDAYDALGLDADAYRLQILAGGPSAKKAFDEIIAALLSVEDPIEQNRLAIELMGTPIEDLGTKALESFGTMSEGVEGATGKVDELTSGIEDNISELQKLQRQAGTTFGEMAEAGAGFANRAVNAYVLTFSDDLKQSNQYIEDVLAAEEAAASLYDEVTLGGGSIKEVGDRARAMGLELHTVNTIMREYADVQAIAAGFTDATAKRVFELERKARGAELGVNDLGKELVTMGTAEQRATLAAEELEDATQDAADALDDQRESAEELTERINDLVDAHFDLVGGQMDVEEAAWDAEEAAIAFTEAVAEGEMTTREYERALNDVTREQLDAASTAAEYEIAQREANGEVLNAIEKATIHKNALQDVADKLDGPVKEALEAHIKEIGAIPGDVTAPRTGRVSPHDGGGSSGPGGFTPSRGFADGGRPPANVPVMVGERGPEMVTFGPGALVHTAAATASFAASAGRGVSGPVTHNNMMTGATGNTGGDVNVSVQIGQTELRDMITDVVISHDRQKEMIR